MQSIKDTTSHKIEPLTPKVFCGDTKKSETKTSKSHRRDSHEKIRNVVPLKSPSIAKNRFDGSLHKNVSEKKTTNDGHKDHRNEGKSNDKKVSSERQYEKVSRSKSETSRKSREIKSSKDKTSSDKKVGSSNKSSSTDRLNDKRKSSTDYRSISLKRRVDDKKDCPNKKNVEKIDKNLSSSSKSKLTETKKGDKEKGNVEKFENKSGNISSTSKSKSDVAKETPSKRRDSINKHSICDTSKISSQSDKARVTPLKVEKDDQLKSKSLKKVHSSGNLDASKSHSNTKLKHEQNPSLLSFADELPEVQGLKPAKDEEESLPKEIKPPPKEIKPSTANDQNISSDKKHDETSDKKYNKKKLEHAEMLKKIESNVEEILAPLSEIEKLALDRKTLKPEDLFNKMMDLFAPEKKTNDQSSKVKDEELKNVLETPTLSVSLDSSDQINATTEPIKTEENSSTTVPIAIKLESEYETFLNILSSVDKKTSETQSVSTETPIDPSTINPSKKESRSLSQSTSSSSHTSGTTSSKNTSSESSSSSETDSSNSSSSASDTETDSRDTKKSKDMKGEGMLNETVEKKELSSPSRTPPRPSLPLKVEAKVSSTNNSKANELFPLPENRETPIKIQMNSVQKICVVNKHLNENEMVSFLMEFYFERKNLVFFLKNSENFFRRTNF